MWLKNLDEPEETPSATCQSEQQDDLPAWMQNIEEEEAPAAESTFPDAAPASG